MKFAANGSSGRDGSDGSAGRGGSITLTYDPQVKPCLAAIHLLTQPAVPPLW